MTVSRDGLRQVRDLNSGLLDRQSGHSSVNLPKPQDPPRTLVLSVKWGELEGDSVRTFQLWHHQIMNLNEESDERSAQSTRHVAKCGGRSWIWRQCLVSAQSLMTLSKFGLSVQSCTWIMWKCETNYKLFCKVNKLRPKIPLRSSDLFPAS